MQRYRTLLKVLAIVLPAAACAQNSAPKRPTSDIAATAPSAVVPPATRVAPVVETHFDHVIADPYRWLEDVHSSEVQHWLDAQDAYSQSVLTSLPSYPNFESGLREALSDLDSVLDVEPARTGIFAVDRLAGEKLSRLVRRTGVGVRETLVRSGVSALSGSWFFGWLCGNSHG